MNILDIITKKKNKLELTEEEIEFFVREYTINKTIKDYQASALLMAMRINGLSTYETLYLTKSFINHSEKYDFKKGYENKILIDKHSSGGVGDKVTIILSPILAALGFRTIKISGRGLGHTGGTIDKLDAIDVNTSITDKQYNQMAKKSNCVIMGQTDKLVPSDKMIYALRDTTSTVDSPGLITASILSKKFVINSDYIFIDLKVGSGALMKTKKDAKNLANIMLDVAKLMNRNIQINITNMDQPLGRAIGNLIEIKESYDFLNNIETSDDLKEIIYDFAIEVLMKSNENISKNEAYEKVKNIIENKQALHCFNNWIETQSGKYNEKDFKPKHKIEVKASQSGYVQYLDTKELGLIALELGAGRHKKEDPIDFQAGIYLNKKTNEYVNQGDTIATLYSSKAIKDELVSRMNKNVKYNKKPTKIEKTIIKVLSN